MNKNLLYIIGILAIAASIAMKVMSRSSRLTELSNYWWVPLPLALISFIAAGTKKSS